MKYAPYFEDFLIVNHRAQQNEIQQASRGTACPVPHPLIHSCIEVKILLHEPKLWNTSNTAYPFLCAYGNIFSSSGKLVKISWDFTETRQEATLDEGPGEACSTANVQAILLVTWWLYGCLCLLFYTVSGSCNCRFSPCKVLHEMFI